MHILRKVVVLIVLVME